MRRHRDNEPAELNVTSFMNLMIVLVPVLLMNMVFSQIAVLDISFPEGSDEPPIVNPEDVTLEVIIREESLQVSYSYQFKTTVVTELPNTGEEYDFDGLNKALQDLKKDPVFTEKTDISLLPEPDIDYQTLISAMDAVRIYPAVVVTSLVDAQLFPDISLGAAPDLVPGEEAGEVTQ
jgi:biopolymer transport protein ExbD